MIDRPLILTDRQVPSVLINCLSCLSLSPRLHLVWPNLGLVDTVTDDCNSLLSRGPNSEQLILKAHKARAGTQIYTCRKTVGGQRAIILMRGGVCILKAIISRTHTNVQ